MRNWIISFGIFLLLTGKYDTACAQCYGCCKDTVTNPYYDPYKKCLQSLSDYAPLCGCDGKTYLNDCDATYRHGLMGVPINSGPCEPMDFILLSTLIDNTNPTIEVGIAVKASIDVQVFIMDLFGKQYYYRSLYVDSQFPYYDLPVSVDNLKTGLYFMIVKTGSGYFKIKKFVKYNI